MGTIFELPVDKKLTPAFDDRCYIKETRKLFTLLPLKLGESSFLEISGKIYLVSFYKTTPTFNRHDLNMCRKLLPESVAPTHTTACHIFKLIFCFSGAYVRPLTDRKAAATAASLWWGWL